MQRVFYITTKYLCATAAWLSSLNMLRPCVFPQSSFYQKPHALVEGAFGVTESGMQVWETKRFAHLLSDSTIVD